jgi:outer membrane protein OmpA-like peptidoglycan-associated protein
VKISVLVCLLFAGAAWADNVTVYDRAPSVDELQRELTGNTGTPTAPKKIRTRAIVFGDSAPAQENAPAREEAPLATPKAQPAPTPAPQMNYQPAASTQSAQGSVLQVSENAIAFPINFRVNSAEILPESIPFLESIAGLLQKNPSMRLLVEGHTDSSGSPQRNLSLSRERAFSVMNYLIDRYRIDSMRLMPMGKGFSEPLGGLPPENPKNRRVQFRVIG